MTDTEIESLFPEFNEWLHKVRGFMCAGDTLSTIKLWEEWLRLKENKRLVRTKQEANNKHRGVNYETNRD